MFEIEQGELYPPISEIITDPNRPDATLEGSTVSLVVHEPGAEGPLVDRAAEVVNATERKVAYQWQEGETDRPGTFIYRWVEHHPDLGDIGYPAGGSLLSVTEAPAYATPAGNTVKMFEAFHDGASGGNPVTLRVTLETASDVVGGMMALPAGEVTDEGTARDFARRRRNAELLVARWIWDTDGGQTSSKSSLVGSSISYQSNPAVRALVAGAAGDFLKEDGVAGGDSGVAYVGYL